MLDYPAKGGIKMEVTRTPAPRPEPRNITGTANMEEELKKAMGDLEDMKEKQDECKPPPPFGSPVDKDNWKHRTTAMRCGGCMFFVEKYTDRPQYIAHTIGRCRRRAPTMNGWPVVFSDDWCGDHKLDEEKI